MGNNVIFQIFSLVEKWTKEKNELNYKRRQKSFLHIFFYFNDTFSFNTNFPPLSVSREEFPPIWRRRAVIPFRTNVKVIKNTTQNCLKNRSPVKFYKKSLQNWWKFVQIISIESFLSCFSLSLKFRISWHNNKKKHRTEEDALVGFCTSFFISPAS